ncbi:hypothetical protein [Burkholderia anthina]|nr:hypothetical protein [Burkholderia anthina]
MTDRSQINRKSDVRAAPCGDRIQRALPVPFLLLSNATTTPAVRVI